MELPIIIPSIVIKQKDKIINIGIIVLTLIIGSNIYKSQAKSIQLLKEKVDTETRENEVLGNIINAEKILISYKNFLNKKEMSQAINRISNIAEESQVKIVLIKPAPAENQPVFIRHPFNLELNAPGYQEIARFINKLEKHPDVYFIDRINIKPISKNQDSAPAAEYNLVADLGLSTIVLKDK